jgi:hypothetical protein
VTEGSRNEDELVRAIRALTPLGTGFELRGRISALERRVPGSTGGSVAALLESEMISSVMLEGALTVKAVAGQINVIVHTLGILLSLPHILEADERVERLSLGAGNTGRAHYLETDRRIGEFKFIEWRGGPEAIRQNSLFIDIFNLVNAPGVKDRYMYVVGKEQPMRFLRGRRAIASVLSRNTPVAERFQTLHGDSYSTVREYYESVEDRVVIVDLREIVPAFTQTG